MVSLNPRDSHFFELVQEKQKKINLNADKIGKIIDKEAFTNTILDFFETRAVTCLELDEAWEWEKDFFTQELQTVKSKILESKITLKAIRVIQNAVLLKRIFEGKYPNSTITFNPDCTPTYLTFKPSRNWLLIDGRNLKDFEVDASLI